MARIPTRQTASPRARAAHPTGACRARGRGLLGLVSIAACAGCASDTVIEGQDRDVLLPGVRASIRLPEETEPEEMGTGRSGSFIDVRIFGGSGEDTQGLNAGDSIDFGDQTFPGPSTVRSEFDLVVGEIVFRRTQAVDPHLTFSYLAGVGVSRLDLELESGGTRASETETAFNVLLGGGVGVPLTDRLELGLGLEGTLLPIDDVQFWSADLGLRIRLGGVFGFFGGWRTIHYEWSRVGSEVDLDLSGPAVDLEVAF